MILLSVDRVEVGKTILDICLQYCPKLFEKVTRLVHKDKKGGGG